MKKPFCEIKKIFFVCLSLRERGFGLALTNSLFVQSLLKSILISLRALELVNCTIHNPGEGHPFSLFLLLYLRFMFVLYMYKNTKLL